MEIEDPADVFARLAGELHDAALSGVAETAQMPVQFAVHAIGCNYAGLALSRRGVLEVAAVSDPQLEAIYQFQFDTGDGSLVTAFTYDSVVRVRDAGADPRWPLRAGKVTAGGMRSVLGLYSNVAPQFPRHQYQAARCRPAGHRHPRAALDSEADPGCKGGRRVTDFVAEHEALGGGR